MEFNLDPNWDRQLYFILSSPRSGSSVLRNKLNYLSEAVVLPSDTRIVEFIVLNQHLAIKDLKLKFKAYWQKKGFEIVAESIWNAFLIHATKTHSDLLGITFVLWSLHKGKAIKDGFCLIEKSPIHVNYLKDIQSFFPRAKLIHLYRDPRSVVSSLNLAPWSTHNTYVNAKRWRDEQRTLMGATPFKISYENICTEPKKSMHEVLEFIGYSRMEELEEILEVDLSEKNPQIAKAGRKLNVESLEKYKRYFSIIDRDLELVEHICKKEMQQMGYTATGKNIDAQFKKVLIRQKLEQAILNIARRILNG